MYCEPHLQEPQGSSSTAIFSFFSGSLWALGTGRRRTRVSLGVHACGMGRRQQVGHPSLWQGVKERTWALEANGATAPPALLPTA